MARGVNKAILLGNVGKEPELRYTQSGTAVCNFTLATTERAKIKGEWQDQTEWHNVVAWAKLAETCSNYLGKGSQIYLEGRIQTRKWEDRDGNTRYNTEVVANHMVMLGRPKGQRDDYGESYGASSPGPERDDDFPGPDDQSFDPNDDVPF